MVKTQWSKGTIVYTSTVSSAHTSQFASSEHWGDASQHRDPETGQPLLKLWNDTRGSVSCSQDGKGQCI